MDQSSGTLRIADNLSGSRLSNLKSVKNKPNYNVIARKSIAMFNDEVKKIPDFKLRTIFSHKTKEYNIMAKERSLDNYNSSDLKTVTMEQELNTQKKLQKYENKFINHSLFTTKAIGPKLLRDMSAKYKFQPNEIN